MKNFYYKAFMEEINKKINKNFKNKEKKYKQNQPKEKWNGKTLQI